MNTILIAYDLHKLGQRYVPLRAAIRKAFPTYWNCLESTFIVKTEMSCIQVRSVCEPWLDANDELLVIDCGPLWANTGFSKHCNDWLHKNV